jgi:23S rRNA (pseudouridine1915-N3)-methyltransferase
MKLIIASVGNKMPDWITAGFNEYAKRMPREAQISLLEIKPEPRTTGKTTEQIMEAEAQRILAGIQSTTNQLAIRLQEWMREGRDVAFIVGGADGLHDSIKQDAQLQLALSALTLPHAFARVLLAEQLYRAYSLMRNHPYHRE